MFPMSAPENLIFDCKLFLLFMCVVYKAMPVLFFYLVVDSTKCITINILRSTGRPNITVLGNTISCLVIMLPLGRILSIRMHYGNVSSLSKINDCFSSYDSRSTHLADWLTDYLVDNVNVKDWLKLDLLN